MNPPPEKCVTVNGAPRTTHAETVAELARELDPAPQTLLIERNHSALSPSQWRETPVLDADRFEVLKISAGG